MNEQCNHTNAALSPCNCFTGCPACKYEYTCICGKPLSKEDLDVQCLECDWAGTESELLQATAHDQACPKCRSRKLIDL